MSSSTCAVIGFGYIGSIIGAVLADKGLNVIAIESNETIIAMTRQGNSYYNEPHLRELISRNVGNGKLIVDNDLSVIRKVDTILIAVGTPLNEEGDADLSPLIQVCHAILPFLNAGQLVIIKSTVPPKTTSDVLYPILKNSGVHLAYCPERIAEGNGVEEFQSIPIVVGGIDERSTKQAVQFWSTALGAPIIRVKNSTTAEVVKLASNWWIDSNIAIANELAVFCDALNVDVVGVLESANSLKKGSSYVNIMLPSIGVGGYCLTKDPWFVWQFAKKMGIVLQTPRVGREINENVPLYSAKKVANTLNMTGPASQKKICVLGLSFKNNTGDCRFTPTQHVLQYWREQGFEIAVYDPLVSDAEGAQLTGGRFSRDLKSCITNANCIAYLTAHDEFKKLSMDFLVPLVKSDCLIFDGRRYFTLDEIEEIRAYGFQYMGVGR